MQGWDWRSVQRLSLFICLSIYLNKNVDSSNKHVLSSIATLKAHHRSVVDLCSMASSARCTLLISNTLYIQNAVALLLFVTKFLIYYLTLGKIVSDKHWIVFFGQVNTQHLPRCLGLFGLCVCYTVYSLYICKFLCKLMKNLLLLFVVCVTHTLNYYNSTFSHFIYIFSKTY